MEPTKKKRKYSGATKHCVYGTCRNDSRYPDRDGMENIVFLRFPKPKKDYDKCVRWAKACSRVGFDETNVKKDTYICSAHFVGGNGPTAEFPDPIPANATSLEVSRFQKPARRPLQRTPLSPLKIDQNAARKADKKNRNVSTEAGPSAAPDHLMSDREAAEVLLGLNFSVSQPDPCVANTTPLNISGSQPDPCVENTTPLNISVSQPDPSVENTTPLNISVSQPDPSVENTTPLNISVSQPDPCVENTTPLNISVSQPDPSVENTTPLNISVSQPDPCVENTTPAENLDPTARHEDVNVNPDDLGPANSDSCCKCLFTANKLVNKATNTNSATSNELSLRLKNKILENENVDLRSKLELVESTPGPKQKPKESTVHVRVEFDIAELEQDDEKCKFFTGLTYLQLMQLWTYISGAVDKLIYWNRKTTKKTTYRISLKNAFVMTLMRLRKGYTHQDLAYRFGTNVSDVSNIILTWVQFLYRQFLPLKPMMFADRGIIKDHIPPCFKKYKKIRCIIDCTEFFCQRPRNFERQGNLYSSYKAHTTYKILVAISPSGSIMFVSTAFEGSVSDRQITMDCGFLDHLNPGDIVMADRGFNIKDLLNERHVELIIPPFLRGRDELTPQEEFYTKDIAKHRIHVERVIERMKKFKILQKTIPLSLQPVLSQMIFTVACLVNFQEPIVK